MIVIDVYDFRGRRWRTKTYRTKKGAAAALKRFNGLRDVLKKPHQTLIWIDGAIQSFERLFD